MIYLVRHAHAKSREEDPERHLARVGVAEVEDVAGTLLDRGDVAPLRIFHSGKTRARETAEILARELGVREVVADEGLVPEADPSEWSRRLEHLRDEIMLVGHLPHLPRLASRLLEDDPEAEPLTFDTATVAALERDRDGVWRHRWTETGTAS